MKQILLFSYGQTKALAYACCQLQKMRFAFTDTPSQQVTHLLLPTPFKETDTLATVLSQLPNDITVIGGKLPPIPDNYQIFDLLKDEAYLAENAAITAHCALKLAMVQLPCTLDDCPVLIIGWGRIGKCLARLLQKIGAKVTVSARKETDRAMLKALDYGAINSTEIDPTQYRVIFNTVPHLILPDCPGNALKFDLASAPGITGHDVVWARGLPNQEVPESSGTLIAKHVADYLTKTEVIP